MPSPSPNESANGTHTPEDPTLGEPTLSPGESRLHCTTTGVPRAPGCHSIGAQSIPGSTVRAPQSLALDDLVPLDSGPRGLHPLGRRGDRGARRYRGGPDGGVRSGRQHRRDQVSVPHFDALTGLVDHVVHLDVLHDRYMLAARDKAARARLVSPKGVTTRRGMGRSGRSSRPCGSGAEVELVHTGQHYDERMSAGFFRDLGIPEPDVNLEVGSGTHAEQTAGVLVAYERYLMERAIDAVVVVGDVNSTVACAMSAVKLHVPVAHVEAGLRSRDWAMPEEVNRVLTDRISQWLFTTSADADENLAAEGADPSSVHLVGNVMIDTLLANIDRARERGAAKRSALGLGERYGVVTLHRPSNVDEAAALQALVDAIASVDDDLDVVFPAHPRTTARLDEFGVTLPSAITTVEPMGYLDFVGVVDGASIVMTDSGGIQEETSVLGVPCLTLRENTERPVTCELGTNRLVGTDPDTIVAEARKALAADAVPADIPLWDGKAAGRIAEVLVDDLTE